jgi:fatty-acid desaturase
MAITSRRTTWAGHVAWMGAIRNTYFKKKKETKKATDDKAYRQLVEKEALGQISPRHLRILL